MATSLKEEARSLTEKEARDSGERLQHSHLSDTSVSVPARRICVIGLGYIGLPTASLLASRGYKVHGVDVCEEVISIINAGDIHIQEPELDIVVRSAVESKRLKADTKPAPADIFILSVPTPFKGEHEPDLTYVESATRTMAAVLKEGDLVILESTSPVGTTEKMAAWLAEERPDLAHGRDDNGNDHCPGVLLAHCPERVLPGQIMRELIENDRIVGGVNDASTNAAVAFYKTFVTGEVLATDARTAEMSKLAENTFRDINIAYANELSIICDKLGMDVWELIRLANHHPRVNILQPGAGVGGHCIAVDPWFIVSQVPDEARLIRAARAVNDCKPAWVVEQIMSRLQGRGTVACLGLSFKPDVDDLRESPALEVASMLAEDPALNLLVVEPYVDKLPTPLASRANVKLMSLTEAVEESDLVISLVRHRDFCSNAEMIRDANPEFLDFVNILGR